MRKNRQITVRKRVQQEVNTSSDNITGDEIVGPATIITGKEASFICIASADAYEWSIENHPKMTRTGPTVKFIFPRAGQYFVQVTLDNNLNKKIRREVIVEDEAKEEDLKKGGLPKNVGRLIDEPYNPPPKEVIKEPVSKPAVDTPVIAAPAEKKSIHIADRIFLGYLEKVAAKEMGAADFDKYLCGGGGTPVIVNGDQRNPKTFAWLCNDLSTKKKKLLIFNKSVKIESAQLHRINGCVTLIDVKFQ